MIFLSGQIGIRPETGKMASGIKKQVEQVMENLKAVLNEAKSGFEKVLKTTIYLTDMDNFGEVNSIYASYFVDEPPARATIEVAGLPGGALVEIDLIAHR